MDKISEAAKKYAEGTCTGKQYGGTTDLIVPKIKEWAAYDFEAGATFYRDEVMRGEMEKMLQWITDRRGDEMLTLTDHNWWYERDSDGDYELTVGDLVKLYFEQSKTNDQKAETGSV